MDPPTSPQIHSSFFSSFCSTLLILLVWLYSPGFEHPLVDVLLPDLAYHFILYPASDSTSNPDSDSDSAMAIDGEKRARGLRVPSLASIKAFSKKNDQQSQQQQQQQQQAADTEKNLPSPPGFSPVGSVAMPAKRAPQSFGFDAVPMMDFESSRYPMPGPPASSSGPVSASGAIPASQLAPAQRAYDGLAVPSVQRTPSNGSHTEDSDPLEDYIPDPSPETDEMLYQAMHERNDPGVNGNGIGNGSSAYAHPVNGNGVNGDNGGELDDEANGGEDDWEPPMAEVAAPLGKLHFACYQEHRSMPSSANVWHAVPCMTCHKQDREIRHRCVFCCLRICEGCFGTLQKCSRRSLDELLSVVQ